MKTFVSVVLCAVMVAAFPAIGQPVATPIAGTIVNPCNGEPITFQGSCQSSGGSNDVRSHCRGEGVGLFGTSYAFRMHTVTRTSESCLLTEEYSERTQFNSARSLENFFLTVRYVVNFDDFCQPQVVVDETEAECRGKSPGF